MSSPRSTTQQSTSSGRSHSTPPAAWFSLASLAVSFLFCYLFVLASLVEKWWTNDFYSYGFLIPLISAYIIWDRRDRLKRETTTPNYKYGVPLLTFALAILVVGDAGEISTIRWISLITGIFGSVFLFFGTRILRVLWFPISYLIFMIPIWGGSEGGIHYPFQLLSAWIAEKILQSCGFLVFRTDGVILNLPDTTLEVADECSGVRYLIAVAAIGLPVGYLFLRTWLNRILLVLTSLMIAIVSNGVRVTLIGAWALRGASVDSIHGPGHILRGLFVSFVGYCAIFVVLQILLKFEARLPAIPDPSSSSPPGNHLASSSKLRYRGISVAIAFVVIGLYVNFYQPSPVPLKRDFEEFPFVIGKWKGADAAPDFTVYRELDVDDEISRLYLTESGEALKFYVAYFRGQEADTGLRNYKAERLLRGSDVFQLDLAPHGSLQVKRIVQTSGVSKKLILVWYDFNGRTITDPRSARLQLIRSTLFHGRRNGAVIIVSHDFVDDDGEEKAVQRCREFLGESLPLLKKHLP